MQQRSWWLDQFQWRVPIVYLKDKNIFVVCHTLFALQSRISANILFITKAHFGRKFPEYLFDFPSVWFNWEHQTGNASDQITNLTKNQSCEVIKPINVHFCVSALAIIYFQIITHRYEHGIAFAIEMLGMLHHGTLELNWRVSPPIPTLFRLVRINLCVDMWWMHSMNQSSKIKTLVNIKKALHSSWDE